MSFTEFLFTHLVADPVIFGAMGALLILLLVLLMLMGKRRRREGVATGQPTPTDPIQEQTPEPPAHSETGSITSAVTDEPVVQEFSETEPVPGRALVQEIDQLIDIEESLMALRELYHRQLITPEVYVNESKKIALRLIKPQ